MVLLWFVFGFFILNLSSCGSGGKKIDNEVEVSVYQKGEKMLELSSSAFSEEGMIPVKYTCDGDNSSPALAWKNAPEETKSFALICDDPDAPSGIFVHWVVYNIPANVTSLDEGAGSSGRLPKGAMSGVTSFEATKYGGPCPPKGTHRYYFKLYALDTELRLAAVPNKDRLLKVMEGHVLAKAELMGTYKRQR
jgi:hypothetical protein